MSAAILANWRELARHADACGVCSSVERELSRVPEQPRREEGAAHERLCATGQELFAEWWGAKQDWLAGTEELRRRQFITSGQLWDDGVTFEVRAAALGALPGPAFKTWLALEDEPRRAQLRALEAAVHASTAQSARAAIDERTGKTGRAVVREGAVGVERAALEESAVRSVPSWGVQRVGWHRAGGARTRLEPTE